MAKELGPKTPKKDARRGEMDKELEFYLDDTHGSITTNNNFTSLMETTLNLSKIFNKETLKPAGGVKKSENPPNKD